MRYNKNKLILYINFIFIIITIISCDNNKRHLKDASDVRLKRLRKVILQEYEGNYLGECINFCIDENHHIYYADRALGHVVIFDSSGKKINTVGKAGRGPAEITNLMNLDVRKGKIAVFDARKLQILIFDTTGNFLYYFKLATEGNSYPLGCNVQIGEDNKYYVTEDSYQDSGPDWKLFTKNTSIITEYDSNGKAQQHFGKIDEEAIEKELFSPYLFGLPVLKVDDAEIYSCMMHIPKIHKYNKNGKLLNRIDITSPMFVSTFKYKDSINEHRAMVSYIKDIGILPNSKLLIALHLNPRNPKPKPGHFLGDPRIYINIYDFKDQSLICDVDITEITGARIPIMAVGPDDTIYFFTDDTPDQVTIEQYKIEYLKK